MEIKTIEYRFSHHFVTKQGEDYHIVKELVHYKDGTKEPRIKLIKDFKRPFWITKPHYRNHKQKKEYEEISKLNKFYSIQKDLPNNIAFKLGMTGYKNNNYRDVLKSPYLYGSDVPSTVILRYMYEKKFGNIFTPFVEATLDIEADVDTNELSIISSACINTVRVAVNKTVLFKQRQLITDEQIIKEVIEMTRKHIDKKFKDFKFIVSVHETEIDPILEVFKFIHSKKPDWLAVWNVAYDIPMIANILKSKDIDPKYVFSDPDLSEELKTFEFKKGKNKRVKADGTTTNIEYQDQWHIVKCNASFIVTDAMCDYAQIRTGQAKLTDGYGIDNVCKIEGVSQKLKIPNTVPTNISKRLWHRRMSLEFPIEYICYNIGDNTMMLDLDEKTTDLKISLPTLLGYSHHDYFNSGPSRIVDKLFIELLEDGLILGTKPYKDDKDKILGLDGWIVTLEASKIIYDTIDVTQ